MWKTTRLITAAALFALGGATSFGAVAHAAGGAMTATLAGGALTVTGGAPGNFSGTLKGANQTLYSTLATYNAQDATGSGSGWNVTFQATQFTCVVATDAGCKAGLTTLPLSSLTIAPPTAACASGSTCTGAPTVSIVANTAVDTASAVKVLSAAVNTGMGDYLVTPGAISTGQLELAVPGNALGHGVPLHANHHRRFGSVAVPG